MPNKHELSRFVPCRNIVYGTVTINRDGNFFNRFSKSPRFGDYANGETRSQLLQILHELAHVVLDKEGCPLIPVDGGKFTLSEENTDKVKAACQKEIEGAAKR